MSKSGKHMFLYGRISVFERLKSNPKSIKKILLQENISLPNIETLAGEKKVPVERLSLNEMKRYKGNKDLQGVIAKVDRYQYASFEDMLNQAEKKQSVLIFLDRISDPHNLGSVMRTVSCLGDFGIVIPQFNACGVTEAVLHVASGGENYVPVSLVSNLSTAISKAKEKGFWIAGALAEGDTQSIKETSFPFPLGLVLGSEGEGIRYGLQKNLDLKISIPMKGAKLSFNVGVACAIFCYEISRQREVFYESQK
ncbi:MAG: 23S rRNA (guanosine(2251)-2'-O)-methyltransferase RlmB [Candidatus Omnitrophica bacterium]|nr:23S rRNA (guanosine(2251)-2'-O)-methyltransferase RlmB [Candidatus Omnitrophota bacterium]